VEKVVFRLHESFPKPKRGESRFEDGVLGLLCETALCSLDCLVLSYFCKISS